MGEIQISKEDFEKYKRLCRLRGISEDVMKDYLPDLANIMKDNTHITDAFNNIEDEMANTDKNGGVRCTGLKFRGKESIWFDERSMEFRHSEGLRLLKRESCKCPNCKYIFSHLKDYGSDLIRYTYWDPFFDKTKSIEDGKTYKFVVDSYCEEAGIEEYHFEEIK